MADSSASRRKANRSSFTAASARSAATENPAPVTQPFSGASSAPEIRLQTRELLYLEWPLFWSVIPDTALIEPSATLQPMVSCAVRE